MGGSNLIHGIDPEHHKYRRRAHLVEMVSLLGPPALGVLSQGPGELWSKFSEPRIYSEQLGMAFEDEEDKQMFSRLIRKMLQTEAIDGQRVRKYSRV